MSDKSAHKLTQTPPQDPAHKAAHDLQQLWAIPLATAKFEQAADVNPVLARIFQAMRATDVQQDPQARFYSSRDDLLQRIEVPEFQALMQFIVNALQKTVSAVNANVWPAGRMAMQLQLAGCWFQIQNGEAFHDVHTHGNCSWSGVYYVQTDPAASRMRHPTLGALNGATRFYGPWHQYLGGAYVDMGNAFLQQSTRDVMPEAGTLVMFPAFLQHKAMPYEGEQDRIIVSFNAQFHAAGGNQIFDYAGT